MDKGVPGYGIFQIITNTTEATYDNVLQLNGILDDIIGSYSCNVSNIKSTQVAVYTIQGKIKQKKLHSFLHTHVRTDQFPTTTVPVPDPPVVTLGVVTATTVTLSWSPQPGVGQYEVHYVRAVGSQQHGACRDFIDTLNTEATTENSLTVGGLQEFSTYTVTVFAVSNAGRVPSEEIVIMTPQAGKHIVPKLVCYMWTVWMLMGMGQKDYSTLAI